MSEPEGLFSAEEIRLMASFRRSKAWRLLEAALLQEREDLFRASPELRAEALAYGRGQLDEVTRLLHQGPLLVVYYQRSMRAEQEAKKSPTQPDADYLRGPFDVEE